MCLQCHTYAWDTTSVQYHARSWDTTPVQYHWWPWDTNVFRIHLRTVVLNRSKTWEPATNFTAWDSTRQVLQQFANEGSSQPGCEKILQRQMHAIAKKEAIAHTGLLIFVSISWLLARNAARRTYHSEHMHTLSHLELSAKSLENTWNLWINDQILVDMRDLMVSG